MADINDLHLRISELVAQQQNEIAEAVIIPAGNLLLASIKNRILQNGIKSDGTMIGTYSTKPMYVSKKQFVKQGAFKPKGQRGFKGERVVLQRNYKVKKVKLKNGRIVEKLVPAHKYKVEKKTPKTMYLESGYHELRTIQGMPVDKVIVNYSGETMLSFQLMANGEMVVIGFTQQRAAIIRKALEKKFKGPIYAPTLNERETYREYVQQRTRAVTVEIAARI